MTSLDPSQTPRGGSPNDRSWSELSRSGHPPVRSALIVFAPRAIACSLAGEETVLETFVEPFIVKYGFSGEPTDFEPQAIVTLAGDQHLLGHHRGEYVVSVAVQRALDLDRVPCAHGVYADGQKTHFQNSVNRATAESFSISHSEAG